MERKSLFLSKLVLGSLIGALLSFVAADAYIYRACAWKKVEADGPHYVITLSDKHSCGPFPDEEHLKAQKEQVNALAKRFSDARFSVESHDKKIVDLTMAHISEDEKKRLGNTFNMKVQTDQKREASGETEQDYEDPFCKLSTLLGDHCCCANIRFPMHLSFDDLLSVGTLEKVVSGYIDRVKDYCDGRVLDAFYTEEIKTIQSWLQWLKDLSKTGMVKKFVTYKKSLLKEDPLVQFVSDLQVRREPEILHDQHTVIYPDTLLRRQPEATLTEKETLEVVTIKDLIMYGIIRRETSAFHDWGVEIEALHALSQNKTEKYNIMYFGGFHIERLEKVLSSMGYQMVDGMPIGSSTQDLDKESAAIRTDSEFLKSFPPVDINALAQKVQVDETGGRGLFARIGSWLTGSGQQGASQQQTAQAQVVQKSDEQKKELQKPTRQEKSGLGADDDEWDMVEGEE